MVFACRILRSESLSSSALILHIPCSLRFRCMRASSRIGTSSGQLRSGVRRSRCCSPLQDTVLLSDSSAVLLHLPPSALDTRSSKMYTLHFLRWSASVSWSPLCSILGPLPHHSVLQAWPLLVPNLTSSDLVPRSLMHSNRSCLDQASCP